MDLIAHNLFLGDIVDAMKFDGDAICVLESFPPRPSIWLPVLQLDQDGGTPVVRHGQLEVIARTIDWLSTTGPLLVYCGAGIERSPLAVAWWMHTRSCMSLQEAYEAIKRVRPQVQDRTYWLEKKA